MPRNWGWASVWIGYLMGVLTEALLAAVLLTGAAIISGLVTR